MLAAGFPAPFLSSLIRTMQATGKDFCASENNRLSKHLEKITLSLRSCNHKQKQQLRLNQRKFLSRADLCTCRVLKAAFELGNINLSLHLTSI